MDREDGRYAGRHASGRPCQRGSRRFLWVALMAAVVVAACAPAAEVRPFLLIGIDGAEWRVIEELWEQGRLPNLRRLTQVGTRASLSTAWKESPVIWTTIATGVLPEQHGIQGFVVPSKDGFTPISSVQRTAPALWDMLSQSGKRLAVLGWWPTWPAEDISGLMVTERILSASERYYSGEPAAVVELALSQLEDNSHPSWKPDAVLRRDRLMAAIAERLGDEPLDLVMVYLRATDVVSHLYWSAYEPERFPKADPEFLETYRDEIGRIYDEIDRLVGRIVGARGADVNTLVISDHGFRAAKRARNHADMDVDLLLRLLGLQTWRDGSVDHSRSTVVGFDDDVPTENPKRLRFLEPGHASSTRAELSGALERVTWSDGTPAASLVESDAPHHRKADALVRIHLERLSLPLQIDGKPVRGVVEAIRTASGDHGPHTAGILIASGPDFATGVEVEGARVHDIAPTVLYALDLPVAADFAGRVLEELYTEELRSRRSIREIPTWGQREAGGVALSEDDLELLEQLRGLGYVR